MASDGSGTGQRPPPATVFFPFVGGDDFGGSHISSLKLIQSLAEANVYRPLVGLHIPCGRLADLIVRYGVDYEILPHVDVLSPDRHRQSRGGTAVDIMRYAVRSLPRMIRYLRERKVRIVHTNDGRMHATWAPATKMAGARLVWHHRGAPEARGVNLLAPHLADRIVTVSRFAKPARPLRAIDAKWSVVHSPFDTCGDVDRGAARRRAIQELGCPAETRLVGWCGELIERKGPLDFVETVAEFVREAPDIPLIGLLLGAVPTSGRRLDEDVQARAESLGIGGRIRLLGFRSPVEPYLAAMDLLLVPAMNEPFGRTIIEAMQLGTVVIAYAHGGNPEAIHDGETGFLVEAKNPSAFVPLMLRLLSDRDAWERISHAAQRHSANTYTRERHLEQISSIYRSLVT